MFEPLLSGACERVTPFDSKQLSADPPNDVCPT